MTCPRGTNTRLDLSERVASPTTGISGPLARSATYPCGEAFVAPLTGEGVIVASSLAPLGLSDAPATLEVADGRIVSARDGLGPAYLRATASAWRAGEKSCRARRRDERAATLTGNVLEDEKILGSVHVAFGASAAIGGTVSVPIHLDVVVTDASLTIDGRPVLESGHFVLDDQARH